MSEAWAPTWPRNPAARRERGGERCEHGLSAPCTECDPWVASTAPQKAKTP